MAPTLTCLRDIADTFSGYSDCSVFFSIAEKVLLTESLKNRGPFTVFAPTNEAFGRLPDSALAAILGPENKHKLKYLLDHHITHGRIFSQDIVMLDEIKTLSGKEVVVTAKGHKIMVRGLVVIETAGGRERESTERPMPYQEIGDEKQEEWENSRHAHPDLRACMSRGR